MSSNTVGGFFYGRGNYFVGEEHLMYRFCLLRAWHATNYHSLSVLSCLTDA